MSAAPEPLHQVAVWYSPFRLGGVETFLERVARRRGSIAIAAVESLEGPMRSVWDDPSAVLDWTAFWPAFMREQPSRPVNDLLLASLSRLRPAILNVNDCIAFGMACAPLLRAVRRYCVVVDVMHVEPPDDDFVTQRLRYIDAIDGMVSTSRTAIDRIRSASETGRQLPMRYIPYGVPVAPVERSPASDQLRLLYVGRLSTEQKRVRLLPPILKALQERGRDFHMTFVGEGPERDSLQDDVEALGLSSRVTFAGFVPPTAIGPYYAGHDILLNVSLYEGFPISIIESMAAGCVPVCTRLRSTDEDVLVHGKNCFLVPVEAPEVAADWIAKLQPGELGRMSGAAQEAGAAFTVERMIGSYDEFFGELRSARKLEPWPSHLELSWDLSRGNPWLPAPSWRGRIAAGLRRLIEPAGKTSQ